MLNSAVQNPFPQALAEAKLASSPLPFIRGTWFFVDPYAGSASNDGKTIATAFASIATAYSACTDGAGDGIAVISGGTTSTHTTSYLATAIDWTKSGITVFGVCAPSRFSQRARISASVQTLAYLINVSGNNNSFYHLAFYNGGTTGAGGVIVSGDRNYFENVHFAGGMGMSVPTIADFSLKLDSAEECTFVNCTIGSDTFDKGDIVGAELFFDNLSQRCRFYGCEFVSFRSSGTTAGLINLVGGDSISRTVLFDNCFFQLYRDGAVAIEVGVVVGTAPNNGFVIFKDCLRHGFVDWATTATARVYSGSQASTEAGGIAIVANPS